MNPDRPPSPSVPVESREQPSSSVPVLYRYTPSGNVGQGTPDDVIAGLRSLLSELRAERDGLREQVERLAALCDEADEEYSKYNRLLTTDEVRAALEAK